MNAPLSRYLTRFSSHADETVTVDLGPPTPTPIIALETVPMPAPAPVETEIEIALREARRDADAERGREIAILSEAHAKMLETALATARSEWAINEATAIAGLIDTAFAHLRLDLSDRIAAALRPLLTDATVVRTLEVLQQTIDRVLADSDHPILLVRGPYDLVEALRARMPDAGGITFEKSDSSEISVIADGMHIETRLGHALVAINGRES